MTTATTMRRFPILFTGINRYLRWIGLRPENSFVDVSPDRIRVRLGWGFSLDADRGSVRGAEPDTDPVRGWGAHGWRGRWLVNGSSQNLVRIGFEPRARARVLLFPLRVHTLRVSVTGPADLIVALSEP
jgi:hypothetical protein